MQNEYFFNDKNRMFCKKCYINNDYTFALGEITYVINIFRFLGCLLSLVLLSRYSSERPYSKLGIIGKIGRFLILFVVYTIYFAIEYFNYFDDSFVYYKYPFINSISLWKYAFMP